PGRKPMGQLAAAPSASGLQPVVRKSSPCTWKASARTLNLPLRTYAISGKVHLRALRILRDRRGVGLLPQAAYLQPGWSTPTAEKVRGQLAVPPRAPWPNGRAPSAVGTREPA